MNVKFIHSFVFVIMAAFTVNLAHGVLVHDNEVCEICLHVQYNDDADTPATHPSSQLISLYITEYPDQWAVFVTNHWSNDLIRGPPQFS